MEKYTCYFKHKLYLQYSAKPGQVAYFTFSRGVFRTLSNVKDIVFISKRVNSFHLLTILIKSAILQKQSSGGVL